MNIDLPAVTHVLGWALLHSVWIGAIAWALVKLSFAIVGPAPARMRHNLALGFLLLIGPAAVFIALNSPADSQIANSRPNPQQPHAAHRAGSQRLSVEEAAPSHADHATTELLPSLDETPGVGNTPGANQTRQSTSAFTMAMDDSEQTESSRSAWAALLWRVISRQATTVQPWLPTLVTVWLLGVLWISGATLLGWRRLASQLRKSRLPLDPQSSDTRIAQAWQAFERAVASVPIGRRVAFFLSPSVISPCTIGFWKPIIYLPIQILGELSFEQVECLLRHELAHIRRFDFAINLLQVLAETLLFFHPCVRMLGKLIRKERERAADDLAADATTERFVYARALLALAESAHAAAATDSASAPHPLALSARGPEQGEVYQRIQRIVAPQRSRNAAACCVLLGSMAVATLTVAATMSAPAPMPQTQKPAESTPPTVLAEKQGKQNAEQNPQEPVAAPQKPLFRGVITGPNGRPVAGAIVRLHRRPIIHQTTHAVVASARTKQDGTFELQAAEFPKQSGKNSPLSLIVTASNCAMHWEIVEKVDLNVNIQLAAPQPFTGVVVDEQGKPMDGAAVELLHVMSLKALRQIDIEAGSFPRRFPTFLDVESAGFATAWKCGPDGKFAIDLLPQDIGFVFAIRRPRHVQQLVFATTGEQPEKPLRAGPWHLPARDRDAKALVNDKPYAHQVEVHKSGEQYALQPAVSGVVRLIDAETRQPLEGETVIWKSGGSLDYYRQRVKTTTNASGLAEFNEAAPDTTLELTTKQHPPAAYLDGPPEKRRVPYLSHRSDFLTPKTGSREVKIELPRGAILAGKVTAKSTGASISYASLRWTARSNDGTPRTVSFSTTKSGEIFCVVTPGDGSIQFRHLPAGFYADLDKPAWTNRLDPGKAYRVQLEVSPMPPALVKFVDQRGNPVPTEFESQVFKSSAASYRHEFRSDEQGQFDLARGMRAGEIPMMIRILATSTDKKHSAYVQIDKVAALRGTDAPRIIRMNPVAQFNGRVVDSSGKAIVGAKIHISMNYDERSGQGIASLESDEQGRFHIDNLIAGVRYNASVHAKGYENPSPRYPSFTGDSDKPHTLDFTLESKAAPPAPSIGLVAPKVPDLAGKSAAQSWNTLKASFRKAEERYQRLLKEKKFNTKDVVDKCEPRQYFVPAAMALADQHKGSPTELQILLWTCEQSYVGGTGARYTQQRRAAADRLATSYVDADAVADIASTIIYVGSNRLDTAEKLMQSTNQRTRAVAMLTAARIYAMHYEDPRRGGFPKLRNEAIAFLTRVTTDFPDLPNSESIMKDAEDLLFNLTKLEEGEIAPDIVGKDLEGRPMKLSDFRGKVVVFHHWSGGLHSWNSIQAFLKRQNNPNLVAIGINTNEDLEKAKAEIPSGMRSWHDPERIIFDKWGSGYPDSQIIDEKGRLVFKGSRRSAGVWQDAALKALRSVPAKQK